MIRFVTACIFLLSSLSAFAQGSAFPSPDQPLPDCPEYRAGELFTLVATILADPGTPHDILASVTFATKPGASASIVIPPTLGKPSSEGSTQYEFKMELPPIFLQNLPTGAYRLIDASFGTGPAIPASELQHMRVAPLRVVGSFPKFCRFIRFQPGAPDGTASGVTIK